MVDPRNRGFMDAVALVMAGGQGKRMRSSGSPRPKPLVSIRGVTLLERSLYPVLRARVSNIVVSAPSTIPAVGRFASSRCAALARAVDARFSVLVEPHPLGNIGCAGRFREHANMVIVVYADNLTTLDLGAVIAHHRKLGASLTLATHVEPLQSPYGEVTIANDSVTEYREKPTRRVLVCSAVSVLGPDALAALSDDHPMGLVDLFQALKRSGRLVTEYRHEAPWIDVNDTTKVAEAERLLTAHKEDFECWLEPPKLILERGLATAGRRVLLRRLPNTGIKRPRWTLPTLEPWRGATLYPNADGGALAEFDDLDIETGVMARHRVVSCPSGSEDTPPPDGLEWVPLNEAVGNAVTTVVTRALAVHDASEPAAVLPGS